jgi:hypothetical protein
MAGDNEVAACMPLFFDQELLPCKMPDHTLKFLQLM